MNASQRSFLALFLAVAACGASGQQVWRCGNSYGTKPCAGGTAVDVTDHQSPADAAQARKLVAEEAKRADAMEKTRLANEKNAPKAIVIGVREAPKEAEPAHDKKHPKKKKGDKHEPEGFTASTGAKKK